MVEENQKPTQEDRWPENSLSFRFCQFVVNRNLLAFGLGVLAQTSFPLITAVLYFSQSDVLPIDFDDIPLLLFEEPSYRRSSAWSARNRDLTEPIMTDPSFLNDTEIRQQVIYRQYTADYVEIYYELENSDQDESKNLLTEHYLKQIWQFEKSLLKLPHYEKFCVLKRLGECEGVDSVLTFMPFLDPDQNASNMSERKTNGSMNDEIWRTIARMSSDDELGRVLDNYLGLDARLNAYPPRSTKLRSIFHVSWVNYDYDYNNKQGWVVRNDTRDSSRNETPVPRNTKMYAKEILSPAFWNYCQNGLPRFDGGESKSDIKFYYYNIYLYYDRLPHQCWDDEAYAFGSLAFIAVFLWFQTRSLFLATFGMYFILTNFVGGNLFYRYLFDYRYFGVFNALAIFLVLAVGVDEIFVFDETWSATSERTYPSLAHRLYDCYRKCSLSIFVPTLATTIALIQTALCPLMALSSFGSFAASVVVLNYISIVTYFPCVLIFYHTKIDSKCRRRRTVVTSLTEQPSTLGRAERLSQRACNIYSSLLWKPSVQALCLMLTALGLGFLVYSATKIEIDKDPPKLFTETHPLGAALRKKQNDFAEPLYLRESQFVQLYMVWGIKDWDRSKCRKNEWKTCEGRIVWDDNFDLNPFTAQLDLLNICRKLRNLTKAERDDLMVRSGRHNDQPEVVCFMDDMDSYFHQEMDSLLYEEHKRLGGLPSTQVKVEALMLHVPQIYNMTQLSQNPFFYRYFEIANLYWLNDGYKFLFPKIPFSPNMFKMHALLVGHSLNAIDLKTASYGNHSFVYGTKLRYAAVVINTTIPRVGLRYDRGLAVFEKWEKFFEDMKSNMQSPHMRQSGFIVAPDISNEYGSGIWHWLIVQKVLITSAWQGVLIGIGLALPILIVFTDDFLVGSLTTFTIACTSISIIGIIPLCGWQLGLLESLNLTLVADLAIDHIVHVAEGYQLSKKSTRKQKVEDLLHEAGISIVSGALTTVGASVFLLFAKIVFFMQFGLFILFTVAFSVVYSLGMFVVLLALIGPEDDRYSLSKWVKKLRSKMKRTALNYLSDEGTENAALIKNGITTDLVNDHTPNGPFKLTITVDGIRPKSGNQLFTTSSSNTMIVPKPTKSIDDDNISSGYESTGVALTGFGKRHAGCQLKADDDSPASSSSISDDVPNPSMTWSPEIEDKFVQTSQSRSHTALAGSRGVSGPKKRRCSRSSAATRKLASLDEPENQQSVKPIDNIPYSVITVRPDRSISPFPGSIISM